MTRLESISSDVAEAFRRAPESGQRRATSIACQIAVDNAMLSRDDVVSAALALIRTGTSSVAALRKQLETQSADLDDEYLSLNESVDDSEQDQRALLVFAKARAMSALAYALSDSDDDLHEAIYEAALAVENRTDVLEPVLRELVAAQS